MINKIDFKKNLNKFLLVLFLLFPIAQISGPFFTDVFLSLIGFFFLIILIIYKEYKYVNNYFFKILIIWNLYLIINSLFSENPLLSLESSLFYFRFLFFSLAVWYILENISNSIKLFSLIITITFSFVLIDSLIQFFYGQNIFGFNYIGNRLTGIFNEERILGSYVTRLMPIIVSLIIFNYKDNKYAVYILAIIIILADVVVYLSGERAAFFYLSLSIFLMIVFIQKFKLMRIFALLASILFIIYFSVINNDLKYRMFDHTLNQMNLYKYFKKSDSNDNITIVKDEDGNEQICSRGVCNYDNNNIKIFSIQHQVLFESSIRIFKDNIFFGIGPKMYREYCSKDKYYIVPKEDLSFSSCSTHPHNTYLQLLSETGIFGTLPVVFFLLFILFIFLKRFINLYFIKNKKYLNDHTILMYIAILITLWPLIPTGNFFNNYISAIYYLPIGFLFYYNNMLKVEND